MGDMADFYINVENGGCDQCGSLNCICDELLNYNEEESE